MTCARNVATLVDTPTGKRGAGPKSSRSSKRKTYSEAKGTTIGAYIVLSLMTERAPRKLGCGGPTSTSTAT
jgi:hypothetical protein